MPVSAELLPFNLYAGLASPLIGSAIAAGTTRRADGQAWGLEPSRCPACSRRLGALELVPVASWVALRGKCRGCAAAISPHYPLVELAAVGVAGWAWVAVTPTLFIASCLFGWLLVALAAADIRTGRQPGWLNIALVLSGLALASWLRGAPLIAHLAGCALGFVSCIAFYFVLRRIWGGAGFLRSGAGMLAGIGAWVGIQSLPGIIFVTSCIGILFFIGRAGAKGREIAPDMRLPFGLFLAGGGWLTWIYGPLVY
jgi:leader peptidase (prepilin peptidase)/N-methyltransferase